VSITILLIILLKFLETVACCFLNKYLNKDFKNGMSLNITSVLTIITLFYNAKLQSYTLIMFLMILILFLL
jgi:hypothetical protein